MIANDPSVRQFQSMRLHLLDVDIVQYNLLHSSIWLIEIITEEAKSETNDAEMLCIGRILP